MAEGNLAAKVETPKTEKETASSKKAAAYHTSTPRKYGGKASRL